MKPQHLIGKLRHTQAAMRKTAALMRDAGIEQHPDEMDGAASIIDSWVVGIQETPPTMRRPLTDEELADCGLLSELDEGAAGVVPVEGKSHE